MSGKKYKASDVNIIEVSDLDDIEAFFCTGFKSPNGQATFTLKPNCPKCGRYDGIVKLGDGLRCNHDATDFRIPSTSLTCCSVS